MRVKTMHRSKLTAHFVTLPNALLRESTLSFKARGILACMLSHSETWEATAEWIAGQGKEGREAIRSGIKELEQAGYAVHAVQRDDGGMIVKNVWTWYDTPQPVTERTNRSRWDDSRDEISKIINRDEQQDGEPCDGFPSDGKPSDGNQPVQKEQYTEQPKKEVPAPPGGDLFGDDLEPLKGKRLPADEALKAHKQVSDLYTAYPRHKQPVPARRAIWKALQKVPFETLMQAVQRFVQHCKTKSTKEEYIPYPASWFNAGSWDDKETSTTHDENTRLW